MKNGKMYLPLAMMSAVTLSVTMVASAQADNNPFSMQPIQNGRLVAVSQMGKSMEGHCTSSRMIKAHHGKCGAKFMGKHKPA